MGKLIIGGKCALEWNYTLLYRKWDFIESSRESSVRLVVVNALSFSLWNLRMKHKGMLSTRELHLHALAGNSFWFFKRFFLAVGFGSSRSGLWQLRGGKLGEVWRCWQSFHASQLVLGMLDWWPRQTSKHYQWQNAQLFLWIIIFHKVFHSSYTLCWWEYS